MASFARALDLGANGIEFDVHLTSDGRVVVIHDVTLDRTTTGSGSVHAATVDEIRSLDAGAWFGPAFSGERVPLLDAVLALRQRSLSSRSSRGGGHFSMRCSTLLTVLACSAE